MQPIIKESELHKAISSQCPAAIFTPSDYYKNCDILSVKHGMYLNISYCLISHKREVRNGELIETMELVVSENAASEFEKEIYKKKANY